MLDNHSLNFSFLTHHDAVLATDQQVPTAVKVAPDANLIALEEIKHQNRRRKQVRGP